MQRTIGLMLWLFVAWAVGTSPSHAATLVVPTAPYPTIATALTAAANGDSVKLLPAIYTGVGNRGLDFAGKSVILFGSGGAAATIIDCQGSTWGIRFAHNEGLGSRVVGCTIRNGGPNLRCIGTSPVFDDCVIEGGVSDYGGGLICDGATPLIRRCTFRGNREGAIVLGNYSAPVMDDCIICDNSGVFGSGGIVAELSSVELYRCVISGNVGLYGGGIYFRFGFPSVIEQCTIVGNKAQEGGGLWLLSHRLTLKQTILRDNCADGLGADAYLVPVAGDWPSALWIECCAVSLPGVVAGDEFQYIEWIGHQVMAAPLLCDVPDCADAPTCAGDIHLLPGSPCLAENSPCGLLIGAGTAGCEGVEGISESSLRSGPALRSWPSPFSDRCTIALGASWRRASTVAIIDAAGRQVRSHLERQPESPGLVQWDGRDDSGNVVASGVYFVVVRSAEGTETKPLIKVR